MKVLFSVVGAFKVALWSLSHSLQKEKEVFGCGSSQNRKEEIAFDGLEHPDIYVVTFVFFCFLSFFAFSVLCFLGSANGEFVIIIGIFRSEGV